MTNLERDIKRYEKRRNVPPFQIWFRRAQNLSHKNPMWWFCKYMFKHTCKKYCVEFSIHSKISGGLYFGHPYGITINPHSIIGSNINIHKGVTIGQENRGVRKGVPTISDYVWIGVNATIVGGIHVGTDVLIAPNSYVNCDVPDHSVVFGNPCIIKPKENATEGYINRTI